MTRWVRAIRHGWVVVGGVPGPDVDEFAAATDVIAALAGPRGGGDTLLAVQHPHRTPAALASDQPSLLALVTGGPVLRIGVIHRALVGTGLTSDDLAEAWRSVGLVERLLIANALGIDPDGPRVRALPAGHPRGPQVDAVLQLAPVPFADVLAVHQQGRRMPRKSTYSPRNPAVGCCWPTSGTSFCSDARPGCASPSAGSPAAIPG